MKKQNRILFALIILSAIIYSSCEENLVEIPNEDENDVYEALLYDLFLNNGSGFSSLWGLQDTTIKAYYLEIYGEFDSLYHPLGSPQDPSIALIHRFNDYTPPVKKGSQCSRNYGLGVIDKNTNEPGLLFFVGRMETLSKETASIIAGWYYNGGNAGAYTFKLTKKNYKWFVVAKVLRNIS